MSDLNVLIDAANELGIEGAADYLKSDKDKETVLQQAREASRYFGFCDVCACDRAFVPVFFWCVCIHDKVSRGIILFPITMRWQGSSLHWRSDKDTASSAPSQSADAQFAFVS